MEYNCCRIPVQNSSSKQGRVLNDNRMPGVRGATSSSGSSGMEVFSMIKHSFAADGANPILKHFRLGKQIGSAGPEMIWKIYDAWRISNNQEATVFYFDKRIADKLHKPRRREQVSEVLREDVRQLQRMKHPKMLTVFHPIEESHDSLAFATEPLFACLANILGNYERLPANLPNELKDFSFIEAEIKYGLLQIADALSYLHYSEQIFHANVTPASIFINKKGHWRLAGMSFCERKREGKDTFGIRQPWTNKTPKMAQPDLNYIAPEIQLDTPGGKAPTTCASDMFAFGMTICAIYNHGKSLIQANHTHAIYAKQVEELTDMFGEVAHRMPLPLVEPVEKMINRDIRYRATAQQFMLLKYYEDPVSRCMLGLDNVDNTSLSHKCEFFTKLAVAIPFFPRKILFHSVFPLIKEKLDHPETLVLVLPPLLKMVEHCSQDDYRALIQPEFKKIYTMTRPVQATVYMLEKLEVILEKASDDEVKMDILPMIFNVLESNSIQGQEAAINVFIIIRQYLDDQTMRRLVLPKAKGLFHKSTNIKVQMNALACIDKLLDSLDKMMILDEIFPFLIEIQPGHDVDIIAGLVGIYKHMMTDKRYGLTQNLLATKVIPRLVPLTACPGLSVDQFSQLMDVLRDMLDFIDRQRRNKMMDEAVELTNTGAYTRRKSIDMRCGAFDPPIQESSGRGQGQLLSVDEPYGNRFRPPSTPELQTRRSSQESLVNRSYRRHSSFQGLGMEEQAVLEKIVRETKRRGSLLPQSAAGSTLTANNPAILVSEPSCTDLEGGSFFFGSRRASTQSMGPVVTPEPGRRDSRGRLLDTMANFNQRRSSFQGICETAMQFFGSK